MSFKRLFDKKKEAKNQSINKEISRGNESVTLFHNLKDNLQQLSQELGNSPDIVIREFKMRTQKIPIAVIYISGLADKTMVSDFIMQSLTIESIDETFINKVSEKNVFDFIKDNALTIGEVKVIKD